MKKYFNKLIKLIQINKLAKEPKIFCISMQRTGTTSTGKFFKDHGLRWIGWGGDRRNKWSAAWLEKDYDTIFNSFDFKTSNAYEDSPWWMPDFYKVIHQRFPDSKFILLKRDPEKWFKSMMAHSDGNVVGAPNRHCKVYRREDELKEAKSTGVLSDQRASEHRGNKPLKITIDHQDHYIKCYLEHYEGAVDRDRTKREQPFGGVLDELDPDFGDFHVVPYPL